MDEARLSEIEAYANVMRQIKPGLLQDDMVPELLAEVRRLQRELDVALTERTTWKDEARRLRPLGTFHNQM